MPQPRKKKKVSANKSIFAELSKTKNPLIAISKFKINSNEDLISKYFSKLFNHPLYKKYIKGVDFPTSYNKIETNDTLLKGDLNQELWWNILTVNEYSSEINEFIIQSEQYLSFLLYGQYDNATAELDKIEKKFGLSHWLIENKIILISKRNGLKEQKEYFKSIKEELPTKTYLLAYHFSQKLESELSFEQFSKGLKSDWEDYANIQEYFLIKCNPLVEKIEKLSDYINQEGASSIIDRYITLKRTLYFICTDSNKYDVSDLDLQKYLNKLNEKIKDDELKPLLYQMSLLQSHQFNVQIEDYTKALDLYTIGDYKSALKLCLHLLSFNSKYLVNILELLVKSELRCDSNILANNSIDNNSIAFTIYECFKSILQKDNLLISSTNKLYKLGLELSSHYISNQLLLFIYNNIPFFIISPSEHAIKIAKLNTILYDIRNRDILNEEKQLDLISKFNANNNGSITYNLVKSCADNLEIPESRKNKYKAFSSSSILLVDEKIDIYNKMINDDSILDRYDAIIHLSKLLFKEKRIEECINCIVNGFIDNNNLIYSLPIKQVTEYVVDNHRFDFQKDINMPILYDLYSKHISSKLDTEKNLQYEIYNDNNGILKPSELFAKYDKVCCKKINYFLEYNCTMEILDSSVHIDDTSSVHNERIKICHFLVKQDPSLSLKLHKEIKHITETALISKLIVELEQKKIYVNEEGIKRKLFTAMNEYTLRYNNLAKNVTHLQLQLSRIYIAKQKFNSQVDYPANDIMPLLTNALSEMKEYFVFSSEYGLAGFLSTNIRHGKLYNFLTSSLLSSNLIIKSTTTFWEEKYKNSNQIYVKELMICFSDFTNAIDSTINNFINRYIQIKTKSDDTQDALFSYAFTKDITVPLYKNMGENINLEDFQQYIIDVLWLYTEKNLEKIRKKITDELSPSCTKIFRDLRENIEMLKEHLDLCHLDNLISHESLKLQKKIDEVQLWFYRLSSSNIEDFKFELPITIVNEIIDNVHVNHNLKIYTDSDKSIILKGKYLKCMVDIMFILYDNCINSFKKNTNQVNNKKLHLNFFKSNEEDYDYSLIVKNSIPENSNLELLEQKLASIRKNIDLKLYGESVSSEGGTGFYKITKILRYDMSLSNSYNLKFFVDKVNYQFIVEIKIKESEC